MTEGVGAHANSRNTCLDAVALDYELKSVLGQRMAITRKKYLVVPRGSWLPTMTGKLFPRVWLRNLSTSEPRLSLTICLPRHDKHATRPTYVPNS